MGMNLKPVPMIVIEQSNKCNLNCAMCETAGSRREKGEMPKEMFERLASGNAKLGQRLLVMHTVGEPLMCSYLEDVFKMCRRYGLRLSMTTNGLLIPEIIGMIKKYPRVIRSMAFSIDGATKETYEKIRRGGSFSVLMEGLELIKKYNDSHLIKIRTSLQACVSGENFNEVPLFFEAFKRYFRPPQILFSFINNLSAAQKNGKYYKDNIPVRKDFYRSSRPCHLIWAQTHVLRDGRVSACCRDYHGELIMGDINRGSVLDIWNSPEYDRLRKGHITGKLDAYPLCKNCYSVNSRITELFNTYARNLFIKYGTRPQKDYLSRLNSFLERVVC